MTTDSVTSGVLPQDKRKDYIMQRIERLKPYQFKPGNRANPHGRPPARLTKAEKLELLAEIARHKIDSPVSAGHKVAAIREANLMEHIYEPGANIRDVNVTFVIGKGYRESLPEPSQDATQSTKKPLELEKGSM